MTSGQGGRNVEELKSLVVQTLETNGVLGQIRAQLRANVYKAIDCDEDQLAASAGPTAVRPAAKLTKSPVGKLMAEIVAEFFEFYQFRHSLSVFLPESNVGKERRSRAEVAFDAGLVRVRTDVSILEQLVGLASGSGPHKGEEGWHSSASSTTASSPPPQVAASMASTVRSTWESSTVGSETPPAGQTRGLGDRTRASLGGGAAVADAISSVVGAGGSRASTADSEKLPKDEVRRKEEESPEEVKRDMRKPLGKLPSLGVVGAGAAGKDLLPPMRSSGLSPSNSGNRSEEVSLGEGRGASKSGDALDEAVASGTLSSPTQQAGTATSRKLLGGIGTSAMAALAGSALAGSSDAKRSASGSPATSVNGSPERSLAASPVASPAASSASASRSLGSPSDVHEASGAAAASVGTASESGSPARGASGAAGATAAALKEESMSLDEGSAGSGSLDLTGGRAAAADAAANDSDGGSSLAAGAVQRAPASLSNSAVEEVEEESIEEHVSDRSFSVEGYNDSEANQSTSNDKF